MSRLRVAGCRSRKTLVAGRVSRLFVYAGKRELSFLFLNIYKKACYKYRAMQCYSARMRRHRASIIDAASIDDV